MMQFETQVEIWRYNSSLINDHFILDIYTSLIKDSDSYFEKWSLKMKV